MSAPRSVSFAATSRTAAVLLAFAIVAGCSSSPKREVLDDEQFQRVAADDLAEMRTSLDDAVVKLMTRTRERADESPDGVATLNVLAMSGGGDFGAFGAGYLVGWGQASDASARRPEFDCVTGVSTGALLAPFAYLGTDEACLQVEEFYRNPKKDWLKTRKPIAFLPSNPSFMTIPGLERDVRGVVNEQFVTELADESRKGKVLAISATDLDLGRQRFWSVGEEAEIASAEDDPTKVQDIMLASAAIPALFPPVEIDGSLYADGGVSANIFLRLDPKNPNGFVQRWLALYPNEPFPRVRYWIIINNHLAHVPKTVQKRWPGIAGSSLDVSIRSATLAEVRWLVAQADYVNAVHGTDIEVMVVGIPNNWRPPVEGQFEQETMAALADLGRSMGANPSSWQVWTNDHPGRVRR